MECSQGSGKMEEKMMREKMMREKVMIVDDCPESLDLLGGILQRQGYQVFAFPDGEMALLSIRKNIPDLILLDIKMPGMDGYEVSRALQQDPETSHIPVIFISGLHETRDIVSGYDAGGVDYIVKPLEIEEVRARVKTHLSLQSLQRDLQKKYDQLKRLQELKDNLVHMIVHDMRSPLFGVCGCLSSLERNCSATLNERDRQSLESANEGILWLQTMVTSILDIMLLEAGEMSISIGRFDLRDIAAKAVKALKAMYPDHPLRQYFPDKPAYVMCDAVLMRRILVNLLDNAFKFTPVDKQICLRIALSDSEVEMEVSDQGGGISETLQEQVFDQYVQGAVHAQGGYRSYGLGLTFVKLATEAQGGRVELETEEGLGSTFRVVLPCGEGNGVQPDTQSRGAGG
jgi:signal transduction histidine kinase